MSVFMVKTVHIVGNSGSTAHSVISSFGLEIFISINRILTDMCCLKLMVPLIMTRLVGAVCNVEKLKGRHRMHNS